LQLLCTPPRCNLNFIYFFVKSWTPHKDAYLFQCGCGLFDWSADLIDRLFLIEWAKVLMNCSTRRTQSAHPFSSLFQWFMKHDLMGKSLRQGRLSMSKSYADKMLMKSICRFCVDWCENDVMSFIGWICILVYLFI
jgi:hypothetical protein